MINTRGRAFINMLHYANYDVVFSEIPDETTLAINLTNCPFRCEGCHTPELQHAGGFQLTNVKLCSLIKKHEGITCVCLMGGDANPNGVLSLIETVKYHMPNKPEWMKSLKYAWYSGSEKLPRVEHIDMYSSLDYIKLGPYKEELGGLDSPTTNQRLYEVHKGKPDKKVFAKYNHEEDKLDEFNCILYRDFYLENITYKFWNV